MNSIQRGVPSGEPDKYEGCCHRKKTTNQVNKILSDNGFGQFRRTSIPSQTGCCKQPRFVAKKYICIILQHSIEPGKSETRASNGSPTCRHDDVHWLALVRFNAYYKRFSGKHLRSEIDANAGPLLNAGPLTETATSPLASDRRGGRRPLFLGDGSHGDRNSCAKPSLHGRNRTFPRPRRLGITCYALSRN